jgi:hypothetical protein
MPATMQSVTTRGFGLSGGFDGSAGLVVTLGFGASELVVEATLAGGVFRRLGDLSRVFARTGDLSRVFGRLGDLGRVFRGWLNMSAIQYDTRVKDTTETILYVFDFSRFPELVAGETISSPSVPASSPTGLTIGSPTVTVADQVVFTNGGVVEAGQGVQVTLSGGTAGVTYALECSITTSGGAVRVVKGSLIVE